MVTALLGPVDDTAELELQPIDGRAELFGVNLSVVHLLNLIQSQLSVMLNSVQMFASNVKS
jgi:hypothetical protein